MKTTLLMTMGLGTLLCLTGCASIVGQATQKVDVTSQPDGVTVTVMDAKGETVAAGTTPAKLRLKAGAGYFKAADYTVRFTKAGCTPQEVKIKRGLNGWYFGNIVFGGLIGMLVVDPLTGAMWNLEDTVHADLPTSQTSALQDGRQNVVVQYNRPPHAGGRRVPIE